MQKVLKLSIMPIVTAPAAGTPTRSKNRISRATRAAELGTARAMNWIPYWSIREGKNRNGYVVAPIVENACGTCATGVSAIAASSHALSALWNSCDDRVEPDVRHRRDQGVGDQPDQEPACRSIPR